MTASRFQEARLVCCLSVPDAGKLFRVTERTIRNWEAGRVAVPYAAFKLMRLLRGGELPGHHWKGFRVQGDTLFSPEGFKFKAHDHYWWSLTVRMAHEFRNIMLRDRHSAASDRAKPDAQDESAAVLVSASMPVLRSSDANPVTLPGPLSEPKPLETSPSPPVRWGAPPVYARGLECVSEPRVVTRGALIGRQVAAAGVLA